MAFPVGWPPRQSPTVRPVRFFVSDTSAAGFADKAWLFGTDAAGQPTQASNTTPMPYVAPGSTATVSMGNTPVGGGRSAEDVAPVPMRYPSTIRITNDSIVAGDSLQFSFDGTNVHGEVRNGESVTYRDRQEAGICIRTTPTKGNCAFRLEAW